jgi:hypothetical protein
MKTVTILLDNEIYEKLLLEAVRKKKTPDKLIADKLTSLVFLSKFYCQPTEIEFNCPLYDYWKDLLRD